MWRAQKQGFLDRHLLMPAMIFSPSRRPCGWKKSDSRSVLVIVDQSGTLGAATESRLEKAYQQSVLEALNDYSIDTARQFQSLRGVPKLARFCRIVHHRRRQRCFSRANSASSQPGALSSKNRAAYSRIEGAGEIDPNLEMASIAEIFKPYLSGKRKFKRLGMVGPFRRNPDPQRHRRARSSAPRARLPDMALRRQVGESRR